MTKTVITEIVGAVVAGIILAIASRPTHATLNWVIPRFNARLSRYADAQRAKRIKRLQETFWQLQDIRAGKQGHRLVAYAITVISREILWATLLVASALARLILISSYSRQSPVSAAIFRIPRNAVPVVQDCLVVWTFILAAVFIYILTRALAWAMRVYDDTSFDQFRHATDKKLKKLGSSLTHISEPELDAASVSSSTSLVAFSLWSAFQ